MSCSIYEVFSLNTLMEEHTNRSYFGNGLIHFERFEAFVAESMNFVNHILIFGITVPMVYKCYLMDFEKTAMHAHLCTIGFVLLMAEGVMIRSPANILFSNYSVESKTLLHALMQFIGGFLGIIGTLHKYWGKEVHFKSRHAKFGLAACILCFVNLITGLFVITQSSVDFWLTCFHGILGVLMFIVGMIAQIYSYDTGFFNRNFNDKYLWKVITFAILLLSTIGPFKIIALKITKNLF